MYVLAEEMLYILVAFVILSLQDGLVWISKIVAKSDKK